jgi:hypothetical protein
VCAAYCAQYFETSALDGSDVDAPFVELAKGFHAAL